MTLSATRTSITEQVRSEIQPGETLSNVFYGRVNPSIWWYLCIGPFAAFMMKHYFVTFTERAAYFSRLGLTGKIVETDRFEFGEISEFKPSKGLITWTLKFAFKNGRELKLTVNKFSRIPEMALKPEAVEIIGGKLAA